MGATNATNGFTIGGAPVYDMFHCRGHYIGMVGPYYARTAFDGAVIEIDGQGAEWFMVPDSRLFTMTLLAKIPASMREKDTWQVRIVSGKQVVSYSIPRSKRNLGRLAMATMVRYDAQYLGEWICHHARLGVEHFYVYNHSAVPKITAILQKFNYMATEIPWEGAYNLKSAGQEPFLPRDSHCYTQCPQMMHAALKYGDAWDWMGFFDADEFLCPMGNMDLGAVLSASERGDYAEVPFIRTTALQVRGKWFGTSNHSAIPNGSILRNYQRCEAGHTCGTKCFVQPHAVKGNAVHYWDVEGQAAILPDNVLRFNHYRSISSYKNRVGRAHDSHYSNETTDATILSKAVP